MLEDVLNAALPALDGYVKLQMFLTIVAGGLALLIILAVVGLIIWSYYIDQ